MIENENKIDSENEEIALSIIIVSFNCEHILRDCLNSIFKQSPLFGLEVIIIDNNSTDKTIEMIKRDFENIRLIQNKKNIGFAAANNQGIKIAMGKYILLLNPDTIVVRGLADALEFMRKNSDVGIIGAKLLNKDGSFQRDSILSYPSILSIFSESFFLYKFLPKSPIWGKPYMSFLDHNKIQNVDAVKGAFLLIRRGIIDEVGLLDEQFFIYTEEMDWCYRANKAGWKVYYQPEVEVIHLDGQSTKQQKLKMFIELHKTKSLFLYKHYSRMEAIIIKMIYALGVFLRTGIWGLAAMVFLFKKDQFIYYSDRFRIYFNVSLWYLRLLT